jgi:hypothetical protein
VTGTPLDDLGPPDETQLQTNAWCGAPATAPKTEAYDAWGVARVKRTAGSQRLSADPLDLAVWTDPRVGWGIVLPESRADEKDKARALDAPECIRRLVEERSTPFAAQGGAPVFRYREDLDDDLLRRYALDGTASDPSLTGLRGVGPAAIPWYLLIVGSPAEIPWSVQYRWQLDAFVGRLDLDPDGLERYVDALLSNWTGSGARRRTPVVWAVDHGARDITRLMRRTIADRIADAFRTDRHRDFDMTGGMLSDGDATGDALVRALVERRPGFIATTSHGVTDPPDDPGAMAAQLGHLVDADAVPVLPSAIGDGAVHGAIWYAHACCSAGCGEASAFAGVAPADSRLGRTLAGLGQVGARTSPLPRRLLGGPSPARAFIGHVEPTFEWTLRDPRNGQTLTASIVEAMYGRLHLASRPPVGYALDAYWRAAGGLWRDYLNAKESVAERPSQGFDRVRRAKLVASDREAMVLLGDPTVNCP